MTALIYPLTPRFYSTSRVIALRAALLREATTSATPGLAMALLVALRPSQGEAVCSEKAAKVARLLRTGDASMRALWRRLRDGMATARLERPATHAAKGEVMP